MKSLSFRCFAFTKVELLAVLFIMVVLVTLAMQYIPGYITRTQATANSAVLETLNKAVEAYRMQGGIKKSNSLGGVINSGKIYNVLTALTNGFVGDDGRTYSFLNKGKPLNPAALTTSGSGNGFVFTGIVGDLYAPYAGYTPSATISLGSALDYGSAYMGRTIAAYLPIKNTGDATLTVSSISVPSGFTLTGWSSGTVAVGATQYVPLAFSPAAATTYSGNITIASNATGGSSTIAITGVGVAVPAYSEIAYLTSNHTGSRTIKIKTTTGYAMGKSSAGVNTARFGLGVPSTEISIGVTSTTGVQYSVWSVASSGSTVSGKITSLNLDNMSSTVRLTSLDISGLSALTFLSVSFNSSLTGLNCFGMNALTTLYANTCSALASLNVAGCTSLQNLVISNHTFSHLNCFGLSSLMGLYASNAATMTSYNVNGCAALLVLELNGTGLTSFSFDTYMPALTTINVTACAITSIDLRLCPTLDSVSCANNPLTSFNASGCTLLTSLTISMTPLSSVDLSTNVGLDYIDVGFSPNLTSLNLSAQIYLTGFVSSGCTSLSSVTFSSPYIGGLYIASCNFNTAAINSFLSMLEPGAGGNVDISGNPGPYDVTTASLISALEAGAWWVTQ